MSINAQFDCAATMHCLAEATAFVERFCADHAIDARDAMRLNLLIEELFTNTVVHGQGGDSDTPVHIELQAGPASLSLLFADRAPPFDPLAWRDAGPATVPAALEDRPVGRLGIRLVFKMATRVEYERVDGWNRLRLDLDRRA